MTVTDVHKDPDNLSMTITAQLDVPVERAWQLWNDPRQLERWWGPPEYPATFVEHDLTPGAKVTYFMTGPEGERFHGWWRVLDVDAPRGIEVEDGFGDETGAPDPDLPVTVMRVDLEATAEGGTRMAISSVFGSLAAMEQVLAMGAEEGMTAAIGQIEGILAG